MNEIKSGYFWLNDLLKNKDKILKDNNFYLKTGILNLDKYVKGLVEQQFYVLAARPSVGKTTFCLNLIVRSLRNLKNNEIIVFFSLEMSSKEILNRLLKILAFLWPKNEIEKLVEEKRLLIVDFPNSNVFKIGNFLDDLSKNFKIKSLIIDHLQLLNLDKHQNNLPRYEKMTQITRQLKILAKDKNINILAISQLSRDFEKRNSAKTEIDVQLSDLRDSGSIEQDADVVMFLIVRKDLKDKDRYGLVISKNRNGSTEIIDSKFFKEKFLFCFKGDEFCKVCKNLIVDSKKTKLADGNFVCSEECLVNLKKIGENNELK